MKGYKNPDKIHESSNSLELFKLHYALLSSPFIALHYFYDSLIRLALNKDLAKVRKNQKKLKKWAFHAPMNYSHKYHLVEAEIARVKGWKLKAMDHYKRAASLARENKFLQDEALALELTAKFWLEPGEEKIAGLYMTEAYHTYRMWGAIAKERHIEEKYGYLLQLQGKGTEPSSQKKTSTSAGTTGSSESIDLATVIKTSQTLSG
ncbi:MAG: hypothetical protein GY754_30025 [bacterium]|nr:hypothetical protein [bacterium]